MRINTVVFFLILVSQNFIAQEIQIGFGSGLGSYKMDDLKKMNNLVVKSIPFQTKIVSDFPSYWYYCPYLVFKGKSASFGLFYNYESTGSRISSADYSGEFRLDMKIHSNSTGFIIGYDIRVFSNFYLGIYSILGLGFTDLKVNEYLQTGDDSYMHTSKFNIMSEIIEPGVNLNYKSKFVGVKMKFGYLFQAKYNSFTAGKNSGINLDNDKPNWNGYRIGLSLYYPLKLNRKSNQ